jgi:hypothetical protein
MPIENKLRRASSRALAHLDGLLDEALEQTFPASDAVAIDIERESHNREARRYFSLAIGRWARLLHRNTNACQPALERVVTAEMELQIGLTFVKVGDVHSPQCHYACSE